MYARRCWISHRQCRICLRAWHFPGQSLTNRFCLFFLGRLTQRSVALGWNIFYWFAGVYLKGILSQKNKKAIQQHVNIYSVKNLMALCGKCDKVLLNFGVHLLGFCEFRGRHIEQFWFNVPFSYVSKRPWKFNAFIHNDRLLRAERSRDRIPMEARFFCALLNWSWDPPSLLLAYKRYPLSFPG